MAELITALNLADPDGFYEALISAHRGLSDEQSAMLNARLVLLLANHIGDRQALAQALAAARDGVPARQDGDISASERSLS